MPVNLKTFEQDVYNIKIKLLKEVAKTNIDSSILVAAMADILGLVAAKIEADKSPSMVQNKTFDNNIDSFIDRARASYKRNCNLNIISSGRLYER